MGFELTQNKASCSASLQGKKLRPSHVKLGWKGLVEATTERRWRRKKFHNDGTRPLPETWSLTRTTSCRELWKVFWQFRTRPILPFATPHSGSSANFVNGSINIQNTLSEYLIGKDKNLVDFWLLLKLATPNCGLFVSLTQYLFTWRTAHTPKKLHCIWLSRIGGWKNYRLISRILQQVVSWSPESSDRQRSGERAPGFHLLKLVTFVTS
jgi:hypothetical protein